MISSNCLYVPSITFIYVCAYNCESVSLTLCVCVCLFMTQYPHWLHRQYYQPPYPAEPALSGMRAHTRTQLSSENFDVKKNLRGDFFSTHPTPVKALLCSQLFCMRKRFHLLRFSTHLCQFFSLICNMSSFVTFQIYTDGEGEKETVIAMCVYK